MDNMKGYNVIVLLLCTMLWLTGCTGGGERADKGSSSGGDKDGISISALKFTEKLKKPDVHIIYYGEPGEDELKKIKFFEDSFGVKLRYTVTTWAEYEQKLLSTIGAGKPVDLVLASAWNFPRVAIKNILQPIDEYINLDDPFWHKGTTEAYRYAGKHYCAASQGSAVFIWYNKTMFENNGVKTPAEYYEEGQWNFENFQKVAMELTIDTDRDGNIDQWGFGTWINDAFVYANDGDFVKFKPDGAIDLVMNSPETLMGLQFIQDMYFKYKYTPIDANVQASNLFPIGKMAMVAERSYVARDVWNKNGMKDEWDVVPFPTGPDNKRGVYPGYAGGWGISATSENPQGAAAYIYATNKYDIDNFDNNMLATFTQRQLEIIKQANNNIIISMYPGIGNWWNIQWPFWSEIYAGENVSATVEKYLPVFQKEIDITLKDK